jgi:ketosteroid isomerase-like protein
MSQENVEIVRRFFDRVNRGGDWTGAFKDFVHDDVEIDWSRSPAPYRGVYRGREEATQFADAANAWEAARWEADEFLETGDDVLMPHVAYLRGRDGIEVKVQATYVFTIRDGRCARWRIYQERRDALEAAGLRE